MPGEVVIGVLGALRVQVDERVVRLNGVRLQTLVAVLALDAGREVTRADLADAVWGERAPAAPGNALQALVSRLRRAVPELVVKSRPTGYRALIRPDQVDANRFAAQVDAARAIPGPERRAAALRDALALWRGAALPGLADAPVLRAHAARLDELRRSATEERIAADIADGRGAEVVPELQGLIAQYPLRETLRMHLMQALRAAGRHADALAAYEDARTELAEQLGADPSPALQRTHLALLRDGFTAPDPPAPTVPSPCGPSPCGPSSRGRLPIPLTPMVGRDDDLPALVRMVTGNRLVTVVGAGGVGKTRLAVEAGRTIVGAEADGGVLVDLGAVGDAGDVSRAILAACGAGDGGLLFAPAGPAARPSIADRLISVVSRRPLLLILDNCEHLLPAVAREAETLLASSPGLRVLATSRQPLGVRGEVLFPLAGLATPAPGGPVTTKSPAVRLFVERGRAVRPAFTVDERTAEQVGAVCRALDGLPLALELAAVRLRSLSVAQLEARLQDRFDALFAGPDTVAERQRTLRTVVDWSWDLLDRPERVLARRMSVFAGPVDGDLVRRVCAGLELPDDIGPGDVERLLAGLVDKSMVQVDAEREPPRFRMLNTIRLYGLERLAEAGETASLRLRHAQVLAAIAEELEPQLRRDGQLHALAYLSSCVDDVNAALRWSIDEAPPDVPVRLVAMLEWYWLLGGRHAEGLEWTRRALALDASAVPVHRALLCAVGALMYGAILADPQGLACLHEALELAGRIGDQPGAGHPLLVLLGSMTSLLTGDSGVMLAELRHHAGHADPWVRAQSRMLAGRTLMNLGRPDEARSELVASLAEFRRIGERLGRAQTLSALAELDGASGEHAGAVTALREALQAAGELGTAEDVAMLRVRLGAAYARSDDGPAARREVGTALAEAHRLGLGETVGAAHHVLGDLARWEGRYADSRDLLGRALGELREHGRGIGLIPAVLISQGYLAVAEGRLGEATDLCRDAYDLVRRGRDAHATSRVAVLAADIALARADVDSSAALLTAAASMRGQRIAGDPDETRLDAGVRDRREGRAPDGAPVDGAAIEALLSPVL
ncbi:AfsR/SARP family transcriptional regulator [Nucisporomicrobium flavum]|uniref:AfsR/SARP family transcriptional regulator n=1 Tax=Nucisporomicrobium flavum TaxID=2785915 RepID=UPI0018F5B8FE|nr:BTAD domain-containing putative transcriptional regulator [Nucisporomicrobium flavum]